MKIEAETVEDYWAQVPDDWRRERMEALRRMIFEVAPDAQETLGWGMLRYGWVSTDRPKAAIDPADQSRGERAEPRAQEDGKDRIICHMNCQARYVGFYIGQLERLDTDGAVRAAFDCGKTCVRVKRGSPKATKGPVDLSSAERAEPRGLELLRPLIAAEAERVKRLS